MKSSTFNLNYLLTLSHDLQCDNRLQKDPVITNYQGLLPSCPSPGWLLSHETHGANLPTTQNLTMLCLWEVWSTIFSSWHSMSPDHFSLISHHFQPHMSHFNSIKYLHENSHAYLHLDAWCPCCPLYLDAFSSHTSVQLQISLLLADISFCRQYSPKPHLYSVHPWFFLYIYTIVLAQLYNYVFNMFVSPSRLNSWGQTLSLSSLLLWCLTQFLALNKCLLREWALCYTWWVFEG